MPADPNRRRERHPYPPGPIEMDPLSECGEVNDALGLRCDREPGHVGAHIQDDGYAVRAWGFNLGGERG